jgi:tetratricopeptide (TPR) repeat protein
MARRAFLPTIPPPGGPPSQPPRSVPPSAPLSEGRISVPPGTEGVSSVLVAQLLDRLASADESHYVVQWLESILHGRTRLDPPLAVRLLRAYRETGRLDRAREIAATLPTSPSSWNPLDTARLAIERAILANIDGRADHAEAELRAASRALAVAPRGAGLREQLDLHLGTTQLELKLHRVQQAQAALRLAEHVAERLEDGAWRVAVSMSLGHMAMRLADPKSAVKHYAAALGRAPARGHAAMRAQGNLAIALGSVGKFEEARGNAAAACGIAAEIASGWRHADAHDVLAIVEIAADRPAAALQALDDALAVLGEIEQPTLRYQLAGHRTWVLAMLGRAQPAKQWLAKADKFRAELASADALDDQDLIATRARVHEACGEHAEAVGCGLPFADKLPDAFVTGNLNLVVARASLALGDLELARISTERAALSGDRHGWVFPERTVSLPLWELALKSGDSRVVRYAEKMIAYVNGAPPPPSLPPPRPSFPSVPPPSRGSMPSIPPSIPPPPSAGGMDDMDPAVDSFGEGEVLIYVTTNAGVQRVKRTEIAAATEGSTLVVDTITHALRVDAREVSLERRRALEPLVVQLLRRAREGLSAEEILRAAGGPGPESADAEHRVRVLISRVRDLLGDPAAIERVRDAGEHGKTRYRLAPSVRFALIEPLTTD